MKKLQWKVMKIESVSASQQVTSILCEAINSRASDIHLEFLGDGLKIYFRIDGLLYPTRAPAQYSAEQILSRLKVLAEMDITEHRLPQEGHFEFGYKDRSYNIRASVMPTGDGQTVVLRILNREDILVEMENLGFDEAQLKTIRQLIANPHGMVLITGPSGSGKTTLLYSIIHTLNKPSNNIITLEDPIELRLPNVRQVQINEGIGFDFVKALKATLRQDPDILMLGEIRDPETAAMSIQAALTGVLVFSSFHTADVPGLLMRLVEMDVPRSAVAQAVMGVVSARLARKICPTCSAPYEPSDYERKLLGGRDGGGNFRKGKGCKSCLNSGFLGRIGIFQIVPFDNEIRACILEKKLFSSLQALLAEKGIKSLRQSLMEKAVEGVIPLEEVVRITGSGY